jgi:hypothetical protein
MQSTPRFGAEEPAPPRVVTALNVEPAIDKSAADWQIILHLRALAERDPQCVAGLFEGIESQSPDYVALIYAAVCEALAAHPDRADLHYYCAWAAIFAKHRAEALPLLDRCLKLAPQHREARMLLGRLRAGTQ